MKLLKAALIGIGGHGKSHTRVIKSLVEEQVIQCVAFTEPNIEANPESYEQLISTGAQHYTDYQHMLDQHPEIDFVAICTPIPLHKPMSIYAMEQGFHVITEKPPAVTIQDIDAMIDAAKKTGQRCGVFFQNTTLKSFVQMNQKIKEGAIGKIQSVTGIGLWKRTDEYYARTPWAGKLLHNGQYVLDGTINNPLAHLLNNCLIVAGAGDSTIATPISAHAELYKGHNIESEDTSFLKVRTANDVEVRFYTTLCHTEQLKPYIIVQGTEGQMYWDYNNILKITDARGEEQTFNYPAENLLRNIYVNFMEGLRNPQAPLYSSIEACRSFVLASNGAFESSQQIFPMPESSWEEIGVLIEEASKHGQLLSDLHVDWAVPTKPFDLTDYQEFTLYRD